MGRDDLILGLKSLFAAKIRASSLEMRFDAAAWMASFDTTLGSEAPCRERA